MKTTIRKKPTTKEAFTDRRTHRRMKLSPHLIEPVQIRVPDTNSKEGVPGIIIDLSAGGMSLLTYMYIPVGMNIHIAFNLFGFKIDDVRGKVSRFKEHYNTYMIAIKFERSQKRIGSQIETMSMDYEDCETRWVREEDNVCKKSCSYYHYCSKSIKK